MEMMCAVSILATLIASIVLPLVARRAERRAVKDCALGDCDLDGSTLADKPETDQENP